MKQQKKKNIVPTAQYESQIVEVIPAPDYEPGDAYKIKYSLVSVETGAQFEYSETFVSSEENSRTFDFLQYLEDNGVSIDSFTDLQGLSEVVTIKKAVVHGKTYRNIVDRKFVSI